MANRRSLNKSISVSEQANFISDKAALLYTWMIPHTDDFGRLPGSIRKMAAMVIPHKLDKHGWTPDDIEKYLQEMGQATDEANIPLIYRYTADNGISVIQFPINKFDQHQEGIRNKAKSQFPAYGESILKKEKALCASESDIEDIIMENIAPIAGNLSVVKIERQVRVKESYIDILIYTTQAPIILELKRARLSNKAIQQLNKYKTYIQKSEGVLIGYGLSANFNITECEKNNIAVITYDDSLSFSLVLTSSLISKIDDLLNNVKSHEITLNDVKNNRTEQNRTEQNRTEQNRTEEKRNEEKVDVPYEKIKDEFNQICVSFPKVIQLSDSRKKKIKLRWEQLKTLEKFIELFTTTENTLFLKGQNERGWKASFDWLLENDRNCLKVLERQYDKARAPTNNGRELVIE